METRKDQKLSVFRVITIDVLEAEKEKVPDQIEIVDEIETVLISVVKPKNETIPDNSGDELALPDNIEEEFVPNEPVELPFAVRKKIAMTTPEELAQTIVDEKLDQRDAQILFKTVIDTRHDYLVETNEQDLDDFEDPEMTADQVSRNGEFSILFDTEMMGLIYSMPIDQRLVTDGTISELFADEQGPVKPRLNPKPKP